MAPNKTVQLPEHVFREVNALKIQLANSIGRIPTNGDVIRASMVVAREHYSELAQALQSGESE